jgi:hypothetical protein
MESAGHQGMKGAEILRPRDRRISRGIIANKPDGLSITAYTEAESVGCEAGGDATRGEPHDANRREEERVWTWGKREAAE